MSQVRVLLGALFASETISPNDEHHSFLMILQESDSRIIIPDRPVRGAGEIFDETDGGMHRAFFRLLIR
jgi:hypothetical protein